MDCQYRAGPTPVRHPFPQADKGDPDLSPHWQPASRAAIARPQTVRYLGIEVDTHFPSRNRSTSEIGPGGADTFRPYVSSASRNPSLLGNSRTSSKISRKAGSGARHMVRYVPRKG